MPAHPSKAPSRRKAAAATGHDCATAFQTVALDCVAAIKTHLGKACAGDAEAVHQIRVAITRLRAAVAFFAPVVVDTEWPRLKKEIGWLNGPLGSARDSDVIVEYARRKHYQAWAQRRLGENLDRQQKQEHRQLVRSLRSARTQRLLAGLARWIRRGSWLERYRRSKDREALGSYCVRELDGWHKRLIRKGRRLKTLGESPRHRLRIKAKRFRYILEALRETGALPKRGEWRRLHRPAKQLQRTLGDLRDLARFADIAETSPPGYRRRKAKLLAAAVAAYRDLKDASV
jgi:CHAD domain-containing protein